MSFTLCVKKGRASSKTGKPAPDRLFHTTYAEATRAICRRLQLRTSIPFALLFLARVLPSDQLAIGETMSAVSPETHMSKTKIIATIGPASSSREKLKALVEAGVDVFRLNFAHGKHEWLHELVESIRSVSAELKQPIGLLADLSGPKIRLGAVPGDDFVCELGATI